MRSLLFVPADDGRKLDRAADSGADVVILDLEDSIAPGRKRAAREAARAYLGRDLRAARYVRMNALSEAEAVEDLAAVVGGRPDGIMLPKCESPDQVRLLDSMLAVLEAREGLPVGSTRILPIACETALSLFRLGAYRGASARLAGLMWGVEDLAVDIGSEVRDPTGAYLPPVELGRSLCIYAAAAAEVPAIDAAYADFRNEAGLRATTEAARRAGFSAKVAIHPAQVAAINEAFTPTEQDLRLAHRIVEAFAAAEGRGAIGLDGKMLDRPHLRAARRIIARAASAGARP